VRGIAQAPCRTAEMSASRTPCCIKCNEHHWIRHQEVPDDDDAAGATSPRSAVVRSPANCAEPTAAEAISICGLSSVQLREAAIGSWALASQEETNRALQQSLEGYRQIIDR
jgi:hypothetical protein